MISFFAIVGFLNFFFLGMDIQAVATGTYKSFLGMPAWLRITMSALAGILCFISIVIVN